MKWRARGSGEDGGWGKFVVFLNFFFDFLSYEGIYCAGGHFDAPPPKVRRVKDLEC